MRSLTFDETQPCCRLNLEQGTWKNVSEAKDTVNLANGQACVYLFTDECIPVASDYEPVHSWLLTDFQAAPRSTYRIDDMGIRKETLNNAFQPVQLGSWKKDLGLTDRFSGEVMYRTQITIPDTFQQKNEIVKTALRSVRKEGRFFVHRCFNSFSIRSTERLRQIRHFARSAVFPAPTAWPVWR